VALYKFKMQKIYQVFVSSTFEDLQEERLEIIDSILNYGHIPVGMELFNASDESQWNVIKKRIDQSDYYVLIISDRYGSMDGDIGYTEKEYDYAISIDKPTIAFLRADESISKLPSSFRETSHKRELSKFKEKIKKRNIKFWKDKSDLVKMFLISFKQLSEDKPQIGWVRSDQCTNVPLNSSSFFYTLDDEPAANFTFHLKNAKKVYILARTAVNLLANYERQIIESVKYGCEFKFLIVSPDSEAVKYIYGTDPKVYENNANKMKEVLLRIQERTGKELNIKTIYHAPTIGIIYVEKENGDSYLAISFYFLHSRVARDRPNFRLRSNDPWFVPFKDEFDKLWEQSHSKINLRYESLIKDKDCPFCKEEIKEISFLENEKFFAIYNIAPILPGHSLIIPKKHIISLFELNNNELQEFLLLGQQAAKILSKAFNVESFNWSIQEREYAGQTVPHLHMHVISRTKNDLPSPGDWYPLLEKKFYSEHIDSSERPKLTKEQLSVVISKLRKLNNNSR